MEIDTYEGTINKRIGILLKLWEKRGYCEFGGYTNCKECATPYLLLKLIGEEILHGKMKRLTLEDWKEKLRGLKN